MKVVFKDPTTGAMTVTHRLRRIYYTTVSVVLFFAPLFVMALTYSLVTCDVVSCCIVSLSWLTYLSWRHDFINDVTYSLVVWKVWSRKRPGEFTTSGLRLENKLRKQVSYVTSLLFNSRLPLFSIIGLSLETRLTIKPSNHVKSKLWRV